MRLDDTLEIPCLTYSCIPKKRLVSNLGTSTDDPFNQRLFFFLDVKFSLIVNSTFTTERVFWGKPRFRLKRVVGCILEIFALPYGSTSVFLRITQLLRDEIIRNVSPIYLNQRYFQSRPRHCSLTSEDLSHFSFPLCYWISLFLQHPLRLKSTSHYFLELTVLGFVRYQSRIKMSQTLIWGLRFVPTFCWVLERPTRGI